MRDDFLLAALAIAIRGLEKSDFWIILFLFSFYTFSSHLEQQNF